MKQLGYHWTDIREILYLNLPRKSLGKIKVSLMSVKNNWYFTQHVCIFVIISR
jgi:hypothetical protein